MSLAMIDKSNQKIFLFKTAQNILHKNIKYVRHSRDITNKCLFCDVDLFFIITINFVTIQYSEIVLFL